MGDLVTVENKAREYMLAVKDSYSYDAAHFVAFMDAEDRELSLDTLQAYIDHMKDQGTPAKTISKRISAAKKRIRMLFEKSPESLDIGMRYKLEEGLKKIKTPKIQSNAVPKEKVLSMLEVKELLREMPADMALLAEFLFHHGTRISETLQIRLADLKELPEYFDVRLMGKGTKERHLKVDKALVERIREHFQGGEFLFGNGQPFCTRHTATMRIKRYSRRILKKEISAHCLRHTFATTWIGKTKKIKAVSDYLGHSSSSITLDMYVHEELSFEDLALVT